MSANLKKDGKLHQGHRQRMRNKLINHGEHIFETYELFEMLLYYVVRYRDTNDIAKRLFLKYKTADKILSCPPEELSGIDGIGTKCAQFISLIGKARDMLDIKGTDAKAIVLNSCSEAGEYLVDKYKGETEYKIMLTLLDNKMSIIKCITMYELPFNSAAVKPEDFVNQALQNHASAAIISYNHPYGPYVQMQGEGATQKSIVSALNSSDVAVPEVYLIVGQKYNAITESYKYKTFMQQINLSGFYKRRGWGLPLFRAELGDDAAAQNDNSSSKPFEYIKSVLSYTMKEPFLSETADRLIDKYGTVRTVISQPTDRLINDIGMSVSDAILMKLIAYVTSRRISQKLIPKRVYTKEEIEGYISSLFIGAYVEEIYALLFDKSGALISCEFLGAGSVNSSGFVPRVLMDISVKRGAHSIILAHNHPGGTAKPSDEDLAITSGITASLLNLGVTLSDHYVVAGAECKPIQMKPGDTLITE